MSGNSRTSGLVCLWFWFNYVERKDILALYLNSDSSPALPKLS